MNMHDEKYKLIIILGKKWLVWELLEDSLEDLLVDSLEDLLEG